MNTAQMSLLSWGLLSASCMNRSVNKATWPKQSVVPRPYSLSPCVWGVYTCICMHASVCFKLSFIHTTQTPRPYSLSPCVWGVYTCICMHASVCFKLSFIHTWLKHHVHIVYHPVYVCAKIYMLHVICLSARMNTVHSYLNIVINTQNTKSLTSTVNLKGSRSHVSGLAGTQSKWLPTNPTVPLAPGDLYPKIRLPLPST